MIELLNSKTLWSRVAKLRGRGQLIAAVAYANEDHLELKAKDILICDASDSRIASGATSHALLNALSRRKVQLWHMDRLHAKVIRTQGCVVVGSANMTANSQNLVEASVLTDDPDAMAQVNAMLSDLLSGGKLKRIDAGFLARIEKIAVTPGGGGGTKKRRPASERSKASWLMGYAAFSDREAEKAARVVQEVTAADDLPGFVRVTEKEANQYGWVQPGDHLFLADREEMRVRRPVKVTGAFHVGKHVYYLHDGLSDGGVSWNRATKKLNEAGLYKREGIPGQLELGDDGHSLLLGMFRGEKG